MTLSAPCGRSGDERCCRDTAERLGLEAAAILRGNSAVASGAGSHLREYTVPTHGLYPHQWNWDSAICAIGWFQLDVDRAWRELESLLAAQDGDGMVAHIAFNPTRQPHTSRALSGGVSGVAPTCARSLLHHPAARGRQRALAASRCWWRCRACPAAASPLAALARLVSVGARSRAPR